MEEKDKLDPLTSRKKGRRPMTQKQAFLEHGKLPPQAVDLEEAVLGAMMLEKDAVTAVIDMLHPDVFYKEAHQAIYSAIHKLFSSNQPIDILTVTNELKSGGNLELAGGAYYITQLTSRIASSANIEFHAGILMQKHLQRELIRISTETIRDSFEDTTDVFDQLDRAEQNLFQISETNLRKKTQLMEDIIHTVLQQIDAARKHDSTYTGVPSGFSELDSITGGWQKSDLIVVAARPGMGKTAFVLSMARNMAVEYNKPVAFFSLEMTSEQLVTRLLSSESELSANQLRKGQLQSYQWEQLNARINKLVRAPLYIDDTPALSVFELRAKCRRLKAQHDIQMIIVDYIQLMTSGQEGKGNREQEISTISRSLKSLSKELGVPVIALSQLNRSVETRPNTSKKPQLSDLRESGAIEQDADLVLFIYRPEYYKLTEDENGNSTEGKAMIIVGKHRNGATGEIRLRFVSNFARFEDLESSVMGLDQVSALNPNQSFDKMTNSITVPSKINSMMDDSDPMPPDPNF